MTKYEALLIASDGAFVTDFEEDTIEQVLKDLADKGSWWYFHPYTFIIKAPSKRHLTKDVMKAKIVYVVSNGLDLMKGWTVDRAIKKIVAENSKLKEGDYLLSHW